MNDFITSLTGSAGGNVFTVIASFLSFLAIGQLLLSLAMGRKIFAGGFLVQIVLGMDIAALTALTAGNWLVRQPQSTVNIILCAGALAGIVLLRYQKWASGALRYWRQNRPAVIFGLIILGTMAGSALALPYGWDEQTYQLSLPVRWLQTKSIAVNMDNPYSAFPLLPQFAMLWSIAGSGIGAARLFMLAVYGVTALGMYEELRRLSDRKFALLLIAGFMLSPVVMTMNRMVYVEPFILLQMAAALRLRRMAEGRFKGIVFGILAASAAAVKLTGAGAGLLIALWGFSKKQKVRAAILQTAIGMALITPFYLRPWLDTGNPLYPFMSGIFGGSPAVDAYHYAMGSVRFGLGFTAPAVLLSWLFVTVKPLIYDGISAGFGWLALTVMCFAGSYIAIRNGKNKKKIYLLGGAWLWLYIFWCASSQQSRFLLPLFLILLCWSAVLYRGFSVKVKRIMVCFIAAAALLSLKKNDLMHYVYSWKQWQLSRDNPAAYLLHASREPEFINALEFIENELPPDSRLLILFERRTLYMPRTVFNGTPCFQEWIFSPLPRNTETVLAELKKHRIDYILTGASRLNPDHLESYNEVNAGIAKLLLELLRQNKITLINTPDTGSYVILKIR